MLSQPSGRSRNGRNGASEERRVPVVVYPSAAGVFLAQSLNPRGSQRQFLASDALHLAHPGVGIEFGYGEKLVAGLFDLCG
jgi:hypothetical protein